MSEKETINRMGKLVRELRETRGLTLRQLAKVSSVHFANLGNIEHGRIGCGLTVASRIADGLNLSPTQRQQLFDAAAYHNQALNARKRINSEIISALSSVLAGHSIDLFDVERVRKNSRASSVTLILRDGAMIKMEVAINEN